MSFRTRLFHLWFLFSRPMTLGARMVARDGEGRVLLVKHTYVPGWHFPGGGVDTGENCTDAAVRELCEETGLTINDKPKFFGIYFNKKTSKRDHVVVYTSDDVSGTLNKANGEIADLGFFALNDLPPDTNQATRDRLAEIFSDAEISPYW